MKKLRAVLLGFEHVHAVSMYDAFSRYPDKYELLGCAEPPMKEGEIPEDPAARKARVLGKRPLPLYENWEELLEKKPDLAIVCSNIARYADIASETLGRGIPTLLEKPMAVNFGEGLRMARAASRAKTTLAINWPVAWFDSFRKVKELCDEGRIGRILRVHYRSPATVGPYDPGKLTEEEMEKLFWYHRALGGGSSFDYACYGCTLSTWIFGKRAERVAGVRKNFLLPFSDVEDYTAYTLDFGDGVGLIEGSWSTLNNGEVPTGPVVYGSEGVIVADRYHSEVKVYRRFSHQNTEPDEIFRTPPWNATTDDVAKHLYRHLTAGEPLYELLTPAFNLDALAALDAGIRSSASGRFEPTNKEI
ncbi:MAG: Gfo/Idh/MocA family oxidoreductase [Clostridia bacterium]|nr:Gfo/Idh/MocA family oxidoreductase [Clostridia bacterium]